MAHQRRTLFVFPIIVLVCSLAGGIYGPRVEVASAASEPTKSARIWTVSPRSMPWWKQNFADAVSPDKAIYKGAIPGMLRTLDPHSNFFDPRDYQLLREDQKGHYYGVGMQVGPRNGKTVVMAPFPGSPAYKAGLRPGDIIVEVNDKPTDDLNTTEIADLLKGPRGTQVKIVIRARALPNPITFTVIARRDPPQERAGRVLGEAGHRLHEDRPVQRDHQPRAGRELQASWARTTSRDWCWTCAAIPAAC